jgi:MraZ protein
LRFFYSSATDCAIDKLGRVLIPQTLREYAKLEKQVVIVGAFKRMEIWSKLKWDAAESLLSHEEIADTLERLGL